MIRSELLQSISNDNPDLRPEEVEQVVETFFEEISARLAEGGRAMPAQDATRVPEKRWTFRRSAFPISSRARKCASG